MIQSQMREGDFREGEADRLATGAAFLFLLIDQEKETCDSVDGAKLLTSMLIQVLPLRVLLFYYSAIE